MLMRAHTLKESKYHRPNTLIDHTKQYWENYFKHEEKTITLFTIPVIYSHGIQSDENYRPKNGRWGIIEGDTSKPKVTYFQFAVGICQNIFQFQVTMKYICCEKTIKTFHQVKQRSF